MPDNIYTDVTYAFDCPLHGMETNVLCFRAFSKENRDRWKKLKLLYTTIPFNEGELDKMLDNLTAVGNPKE